MLRKFARVVFGSAGGGGGGAVTSVFGRIGAVVAAVGDYTSSQVNNSSGVAGGTVTAALNTLAAAIGALVTGVSSFNARTGAVVPATGDYQVAQLGTTGLTEGAVPFFNGSAWQTVGVRTSGLADADATLNYGTAACFFFQGSATANRTLTIGVTGLGAAPDGMCISFVLCDVGGFTWKIANGGTSPNDLYTKPTGIAQLIGIRYDGADWVLAGVQDLVFS